MKYSQNDVDLYTDACRLANEAKSVFAKLHWSKIAESLRPCHYDGPDN